MRSHLLLVITAFIWGVSFVAQSVGMDYVGPFTFNGIRCLIGGTVLLPYVFWKKKENSKNYLETKDRKRILLGGILCGIALFIASSLQQVGIQYTTVGKAGFITTLYIVLVPSLGCFLGKKISKKIGVCVALAMIGMYLLCITEKMTIGKGDCLVILCALFFSIHILCIDYFSPNVDGVFLSCIQFFTSGLISLFVMVIWETPSLGAIVSAWQPIFYAGVLSCGVAYTLQIIAQKDTTPTIASLILSLESVFAVMGGVFFLNESMTKKELLGCGFVFLSIILAQLPERQEKQKSNNCME